jgi:hypothetical protein
MSERNQAMSDEQVKVILDLPTLDDEMKRGLLITLAQTMDARRRNIIALKLAENGVGEAIPILTRLMHLPDTAGNRGTLLYSLDELGAKLQPKELLHLMMTDTYEVQTQAFEMLENRVDQMASADLRIMLNMVLDQAPSLDTEHREAAAVASELLVSAFIQRVPSSTLTA